LNFDLRERPQKLFDIGGEFVETEAGDGHQTDRSRNNISHFFQLMLKALVVANNFPAGLVKQLAFAGQCKLFAGAFEKRDTEALFDGAELLADR